MATATKNLCSPWFEGVDTMYSVLYWGVVTLLLAWTCFAMFEMVRF